MNKETEKTESLFRKLYKGTKEYFDAARLPFIEDKIKGKLKAGYRDAKMQVITAQEEKEKLRENIRDYDIDKAIKLSADIINAEATAELIEKEYRELFNEEISK